MRNLLLGYLLPAPYRSTFCLGLISTRSATKPDRNFLPCKKYASGICRLTYSASLSAGSHIFRGSTGAEAEAEADEQVQHQDLSPEVLQCGTVHHQRKADTDRHNKNHNLEVLLPVEVALVPMARASLLGTDQLVATEFPDLTTHPCPRMVTTGDPCQSSFRAAQLCQIKV